jgi:hypothetical protein
MMYFGCSKIVADSGDSKKRRRGRRRRREGTYALWL